ncbi:MAG: 16S rRNA (guanine(966)-N(2))-methyltransferase RsmD [Myxococcota bacterium]
MRVIAGSARGRRLAAPKGKGTRPTPDRVREALFSTLFSMAAPEIVGARVLDLFAGTGALGIEALSRGAAHSTFVEQDRGTAALLATNLHTVAGADTELLQMPVARALAQLDGGAPFDIVFADPPYDLELLQPTVDALVQHALVSADGLVVCEHGSRQKPPAAPSGWAAGKTRSYGDVALTFFQVDKGDQA